MENAVKARLKSVHLADAQKYRNITIVPLIAPVDGAVHYNTLGEALATPDLVISEVSAAGSVPDLMVANRANKSVLLIDGEELAGAKQNRVLNTSILLKELSETKIPVSCTEQRRWSYTSKVFSESGHMMAHKTRSYKTSSVHSSLESSGTHHSDQGQVWANIAELHSKAHVQSSTSAMSDVYKAREAELRSCDEVFKPVANQVGLVAFIGGRPVGAELVSLTGAYAKLHLKLIRSYTLEALIESSSEDSATNLQPAEPADIAAQASQFLDEIEAAEERQFPSIGHGTEFRYRSRGAQVTGSQPSTICGTALVHENEVIHAAFFRLEAPSTTGSDPTPYRSRWRGFSG